MSSAVVLDTNVLLVADGQHPDVGDECLAKCVDLLEQVRRRGVIVIDDEYRVLREYQGKLPGKGKRLGSVFLKWLQQNKTNRLRVHQVTINESSVDWFEEFPDQTLQRCFDPKDRKFVAISAAHPDKPDICEATDCKWLDWAGALSQNGIKVIFCCPKDILKFYSNKFPDKDHPSLP